MAIIFKGFTDSDSLEIYVEDDLMLNQVQLMKCVGKIDVYPELKLTLNESINFYLTEQILSKMHSLQNATETLQSDNK